jgi:hypothetical protein
MSALDYDRLACLANALADLCERSQAREARWLEAVSERDRKIAALQELCDLAASTCESSSATMRRMGVEIAALRKLAREASHALNSTAREAMREGGT